MPLPALRAPAKLNLFLHLTGKRADGYHLLESLVAFTDLADTITLEMAETLSLAVDGAFAAEAGDCENNLVLKAARALQSQSTIAQGARITLTKNIPVGAGLGGGSADAAAALNGLNRLWKLGLSDAQLHGVAVSLGADVAMCLNPKPVLVRGIGDVIEPLTHPLPPLYALLVHPRVLLLTKEVYGMVGHGAEAGSVTSPLGEVGFAQTLLQRLAANPGEGAVEFMNLLSHTQNHLQPAAIRVNPIVAEVLFALETLLPKPFFVRMTGSGACCFALYGTMEEATRAGAHLAKEHPQWWVRAVTLLPTTLISTV